MIKKIMPDLKWKSDPIDVLTAVFFIFVLFVCLLKAHRYQYPNLIFTYPFISNDGFQWICDGLHYLDRNIGATHRNPALPLTFAALRYFDLVDYYPWIIALLTISFYASAYLLVRQLFSRAVTLLTVVWFFFVFRIHNFFDFVLADPWCLTLINVGLSALLRSETNPKMLLFSAAAFGLSLSYQFAPVFCSPALIWFVFRGIGLSRLAEKKVVIFFSILIFLILFLLQFIYKWIVLGNPFYVGVTHFNLVRPHLMGVVYYAVNFVAFLGWPLALVVISGIKSSLNYRTSQWLLIHLYSICMLVFWVFFYLWLDVRFLLYLLPGLLVYAARGVECLNLLTRISPFGKNPIQKSMIFIGVYLAISMASFKTVAFEAALLPILPQVAIRFSTKTLGKWNLTTITTEKINTEVNLTTDATLSPISYFQFYQTMARAPRTHSVAFIDDMLVISKIISEKTTSSDRIGLCDDLFSDHPKKMRIHFTLARNVEDCSLSTEYWIVNNHSLSNIELSKSQTVAWSGRELSLVATTR